jgi:dTMP kinase
LRPLLRAGTWVLLDRFVDSSLAYQGGGRELGIEAVRDVNEFAIRGLHPDRTLLLTLEPELGRSRSSERGAPLDRLEREQEDFFKRTAAVYQELSAQDPDRIRTIDASRPPDRVLAAAVDALSDLL